MTTTRPCTQCGDMTRLTLFDQHICHFCIQEYKANLRKEIKQMMLQDKIAKPPTRKVRIFVQRKRKTQPIEINYYTHHGLHAAIRQEVNEKVTRRWAFFDIETIDWELVA